MSGISAVIVSLFIGYAPPMTMAEWRARWVDPVDGRIALPRDASNPIQPFYLAHELCCVELWNISINGAGADAREARGLGDGLVNIAYRFKER